jgi:glycosyltransferase involved in cell wall biosynthesis
VSDVLLVGSANTLGWRTIEDEFAASLKRLGVSHRLLRPQKPPGRLTRQTLLGAELSEARRAAAALRRALAEERPRAVVLMSSTAAFLAPLARLRREGIAVAVRIDCPAAVNRPGAAGLIQRRLERRRLAAAGAVIAMGPRSAEVTREALGESLGDTPLIALPTTINVPPAAAEPERPFRVLAHGGDPARKGLDQIVAAWNLLDGRQGDATLTITGIEPLRALGALARARVEMPEGLELPGPVSRGRQLELLHGATAYVSASRWEEWGIGQLEALAAGVPLATTPSHGAYEAGPIVRRIAPELHAADPPGLAEAILIAMRMSGEARERYGVAARDAVRPFAPDAVDRVMAGEVLPALGVSDRPRSL